MKDIKNNFIPYEEAKELKELKFDSPCLAYYYKDDEELSECCDSVVKGYFFPEDDRNNDFIASPLFQQAFEFFREKHDMHGYIKKFKDRYEWIIHSSEFGKSTLGNMNVPDYSTYEGAQLECLRTLIKLAKK